MTERFLVMEMVRKQSRKKTFYSNNIVDIVVDIKRIIKNLWIRPSQSLKKGLGLSRAKFIR